MIYIFGYQVRFKRFLGRIDLFNEFSILMISLHMIAFTDFVLDPEVQFTIGFSMLGLTILNFATNVLLLFYSGFLEMKHDFIVKRNKKNYEKLLADRIKEQFTKKTENAFQNIIMVKAKDPLTINT